MRAEDHALQTSVLVARETAPQVPRSQKRFAGINHDASLQDNNCRKRSRKETSTSNKERIKLKLIFQIVSAFANFSCRYACHNCEWRNVRGNDRPCCDYRSFAYFDPGQDCGSISNPDPISDDH